MTRLFNRAFVAFLVFLLVAPGVAAQAAASARRFADVPDDHPDRSYILFLADRNLIKGYPDGLFHPDAPISRGEAATIAVPVAGLAPRPAGSSAWAMPYVQAGLDAGLFRGPEGGDFHPDQPLTRADLAVWAIRAARRPVNRLPDLRLMDVSPTHRAYPEILLAVASGMMTAPGGYFRPDESATRAEAARAFAQAAVYTPLAYDTPLPVVVEPTSGQVEIAETAGEAYHAITAATPLPEGGRIRTAGASTADVHFPDGSALRVAAGSELLLTRSHGSQQVWGTAVEDLQVTLLQGRVFGALMPLLAPHDLVLLQGRIRLARDPVAADSGSDPSSAEGQSGDQSSGQLPAGITRLMLFASPDSLEPGDATGAELTVVLADDAGEPVTADQGPVHLQLSSDTGRFSNDAPVIPQGYQAVTVQLYPAAEEPADAKTRVTAAVGEITSALTVPTTKVSWWQALFTRRVRATVRMPWSVATVRGSRWSAAVDPGSNSFSLLSGSGSLAASNGNQVALTGSQESQVTSPTGPPAPPGPLSPAEEAQWRSQQNWVDQVSNQLNGNVPPDLQGQLQQEDQQSSDTLATLPPDTTPPAIAITDPAPGTRVTTSTVTVSGRASDNVGLASVTVGGSAVGTDTSGAWSASVDLAPGPNVITATAVDGSGNRASASVTVQFEPGPTGFNLTAPVDGLYTRLPQVKVAGTVTAPENTRAVKVNGDDLLILPDGSFADDFGLRPGENRISVTLIDKQGNEQSDTRTVYRLTEPPILTLSAPRDGMTVYEPEVTVKGSVKVQSGPIAGLTIAGQPAQAAADGGFSVPVALTPGKNTVTVEAADAAGNVTRQSVTVTYADHRPALTVNDPADGLKTELALLPVTGRVDYPGDITQVLVNGRSIALTGDGTFLASVPLALGANTISVQVGEQTVTRTVTRLAPLGVSLSALPARVTDGSVRVSGVIRGADGTPAVTVNGAVAAVSNGSFTGDVRLEYGSNTISVQVTDGAGRTASALSSVWREYPAPPPITTPVADPAQTTLSASPSQLSADGYSTTTITIQLKDAQGNPMTTSGGSATLHTDLGALGPVTDHGDGTYTATLTAPAAPGAATITGTVNSVAITGSATVTFLSTDPPTVTISAPTNSSSTENASVTIQGTYTAPAGLQSITVNGKPIAHGTGTFSGSVNLASGPNTFYVDVKDNLNHQALASVLVYRRIVSYTKSTVVAADTQVTADGHSTTTITVQLKDSSGIPLAQSHGTVTMQATVGTTGTVTDNGDGTYTATYTAPLPSVGMPSTDTITATLNGSPLTNTAQIQLASMPK